MTTPSSTQTGSMLMAVLLTAFFLMAPGTGAGEPGDDNSVFVAKARELVTGKASHVDKIMAVHAFVRDSIRQVETQYG